MGSYRDMAGPLKNIYIKMMLTGPIKQWIHKNQNLVVFHLVMIIICLIPSAYMPNYLLFAFVVHVNLISSFLETAKQPQKRPGWGSYGSLARGTTGNFDQKHMLELDCWSYNSD